MHIRFLSLVKSLDNFPSQVLEHVFFLFLTLERIPPCFFPGQVTDCRSSGMGVAGTILVIKKISNPHSQLVAPPSHERLFGETTYFMGKFGGIHHGFLLIFRHTLGGIFVFFLLVFETSTTRGRAKSCFLDSLFPGGCKPHFPHGGCIDQAPSHFQDPRE